MMTKISLSVDLIERRQKLDDDGKSRINAIRESLRASSQLIDRLLFVTHVPKNPCAPFKLDPVVRDATKGFSEGPISIQAKLDTKGWLAVAEVTVATCRPRFSGIKVVGEP